MDNLGFRIKYFTRRNLLRFLGPAQLDEQTDPVRRLNRERDAKLGPRPKKPHEVYIPKRHMSDAQHKTDAAK